MIAFARASCRVSRAISRFRCWSRRFCAVAGLTFGPRRTAPSDASSARANCLRQPVSIEEYIRSLRINAPRSPGFLHRSYSRKIRRLSDREITRRRLTATTSGLEALEADLCAASDPLMDELSGSAEGSDLPFRVDD